MKRTLAVLFAAGALLLAAPMSQASLISISTTLLGANESPPVSSPATGSALVEIDTVALTLHLVINYSGLTSNTTAAHIHCCLATPLSGNVGVATTLPAFPGFTLGTTSGSYNNTLSLLDAGTYNPAFVTAQGGIAAAANALIAGITTGRTYLNIHTVNNPGGEIRGFLIPEPQSLALLGIGMLTLVFGLRVLRR